MKWQSFSWPWIILFLLFVIVQGMYLHRVPGLLGDEGSEGENVYQLLHADHITVVGERSYIGPWIDYVRVPFVALFGYTTLAIRVPMLLASILVFFLTASVLRSLFGDNTALLGTAFLTFSPIYISYQRLGWAITLLPLFALLIAWLAQRGWKYSSLLTGLATGIGLSTHIMFLPALVALLGMGLFYQGKRKFNSLVSWWPSLVGFVAGFGMQFIVLSLLPEDQGMSSAVAKLFSERFIGLKGLIPLLVSGSSYVAAYTGVAFSPSLMWVITIGIFGLALASFLLPKKKLLVLALWTGLIIQVLVLVYMIDRYTLRYFVVPVLWLWMLAGLGAAALVQKVPQRLAQWGAVVVACVFAVWIVVVLFVPYMQTGGSTGDVSLSNRTESAAALVDVRPLLDCLAHTQNVFSENVHILNRLTYLAHSNLSLSILSEEDKGQMDYSVSYHTKDSVPAHGVCSGLSHFEVLTK